MGIQVHDGFLKRLTELYGTEFSKAFAELAAQADPAADPADLLEEAMQKVDGEFNIPRGKVNFPVPAQQGDPRHSSGIFS